MTSAARGFRFDTWVWVGRLLLQAHRRDLDGSSSEVLSTRVIFGFRPSSSKPQIPLAIERIANPTGLNLLRHVFPPFTLMRSQGVSCSVKVRKEARHQQQGSTQRQWVEWLQQPVACTRGERRSGGEHVCSNDLLMSQPGPLSRAFHMGDGARSVGCMRAGHEAQTIIDVNGKRLMRWGDSNLVHARDTQRMCPKSRAVMRLTREAGCARPTRPSRTSQFLGRTRITWKDNMP